MKRRTSTAHVERPRGQRRRILGLLRETFRHLAQLEQRTLALRERVAHPSMESHLRESLDAALRDLDATRQRLAERACSLGFPESAVQAPRAGQKTQSSPKKPEILAARLVPSCEACAKMLCSLVQAAREINDTACERVACFLVQTLEKLLCLLQPQVLGAEFHALSRVSNQFQLREIVP